VCCSLLNDETDIELRRLILSNKFLMASMPAFIKCYLFTILASHPQTKQKPDENDELLLILIPEMEGVESLMDVNTVKIF